MRIIVLGYVVRGPLGGLAWHHLQYAVGLARLGHDVFFLEDSEDYPHCYDPETNAVGPDAAYGLRFAADAFARLGLGDRWAYYDAPQRQWTGPASGIALDVCRTADLLLNVSAVNPIRPWTEDVPVRVLIDTDPVFVQARHLRNPDGMAFATKHNAFFTFAANVEGLRALVDDGLAWKPTRQPVVLDCWKVTQPPAGGAFTTVMQWESYPPVVVGRRTFGMKSHSFPAFVDLPKRVSTPFELAIGAAPSQLGDAGWRIRNSLEVTRDPWTYRDFLRGSLAEFSVAKEAYVAARSGWFSERSANYMASGRAVLVQDTGFSESLPVGRGVIAFTNLDEAVAGAEAIVSDPAGHGRDARELAEMYFASERVLGKLLEDAMAVGSR